MERPRYHPYPHASFEGMGRDQVAGCPSDPPGMVTYLGSYCTLLQGRRLFFSPPVGAGVLHPLWVTSYPLGLTLHTRCRGETRGVGKCANRRIFGSDLLEGIDWPDISRRICTPRYSREGFREVMDYNWSAQA